MVKLIARGPVTMRSGRDARPGSIFEVESDEADELLASGKAEHPPKADEAAEDAARLARTLRGAADLAEANAARGGK